MLNKKIAGLVICLLLLGGVLAVYITQQAEEVKVKVEVPQELTIAVVRDIGGHRDFEVRRAHIFETLVGAAPGAMRPEPMLATHWEVSEDGLTWTFYLREGVKFHDGTPFTADAVKFSLERILERRGAIAQGIFKIESMEIVDDYTIKITNTEPWAAFPAHLAHGLGYIVSPTAVDQEGDIIEPIGTGPFKFHEYIPEERVVVVRNEDHWRGLPKLERITFVVIPDHHTRIMALKAGEVDVIQFVPEGEVARLDAHSEITVLTTPSVRTHFLVFNTETEPFDNILVRQAVDYAINQKALVEHVLDGMGVPARGQISPAIRWSIYDELPEPRYDPEKARTLLAEVGWKDADGDGILDKDGEPFRITLLLTGLRPQWPPMAEVIQAQLRDVGINADLRVLEWGAYIDATGTPGNRPLDMHLFFGSGGTLAADADYGFWIMHHTDSKFFQAMHINEDKLIERGLGTMDDDERFAIYGELQKIIRDSELSVFLFHQEEIVALRDHVHGFQVHPTQVMDHVPLWEVSIAEK
ncbi:ABC transporter substrate-binding protein [Thermodesulfovibrionales bacterium]|nr:ABC transporter substrate-binding protein [Thermodesulfovibrionales bacterium]